MSDVTFHSMVIVCTYLLFSLERFVMYLVFARHRRFHFIEGRIKMAPKNSDFDARNRAGRSRLLDVLLEGRHGGLGDQGGQIGTGETVTSLQRPESELQIVKICTAMLDQYSGDLNTTRHVRHLDV